MIKAAVLIPVFTESESVLFTVRTRTVEHHKGQISFPGGRFEESDGSLLNTALRETEEEVGIKSCQIRVTGELSPVNIPVTNFLVTPFVARIKGNPEIRLNLNESACAIFVPLAHLLDPANSTLETYEHNGLQFQLKSFHFEGHRIWGATARMVQLFLESGLSNKGGL